MNVQISKWGNSLGIRIPKAFAESLGLDENISANMHIDNNRLIIEAEKDPNTHDLRMRGQKYNLADMLAQMESLSEKERQSEDFDDTPLESELWDYEE